MKPEYLNLSPVTAVVLDSDDDVLLEPSVFHILDNLSDEISGTFNITTKLT
jgi:hypothetical protein